MTREALIQEIHEDTFVVFLTKNPYKTEFGGWIHEHAHNSSCLCDRRTIASTTPSLALNGESSIL